LLVAAFTAVGLILFFGPKNWWPSFYSPTFFAVVFFVSAIALVLPKYFFKTPDRCKQEAVIFLRSAVAFAVVTNALGELYFYQLYQYGLEYDKLIHFASTFFLVVAFAFFWQIWREASFDQALKLSIALAVSASLLWEGFEFFSDLVFKTAEFGIYGFYKLPDTAKDIVLDFLGIALGIIFLKTPGYRQKSFSQYCRRASLNLARAKARINLTKQGA